MISTETKAAFDSASQYFAQPIQQFQYFDKYSRFDYAKGRRETWPETCDRAVTFLRGLIRTNVPNSAQLAEQVITEAERQSLLNMQALPSMRTIAMAGEAASRQNVCTFNCAFLPTCDTRAYAEALLISMSGCGVGFSVEKKYVDQLPAVAKQHARTEDLAVHVVEDSTEGWCRALLLGLNTWFGGGDIDFDLTQLRPAGAALRIKGGRASGPRPLSRLLSFARNKILSRQGGRLTPLDAHDIMCAVGDAAVCGGHRRTAMISLYDPGEVEMRAAKNGADFPDVRWNSNNSEAWGTEPLSDLQLLQQMVEMFAGERGEPGIFSRRAAKFTLPARRKWCPDFGVNPCQPDFATLLTPDGIRTMGQLDVGDTVWSGKRWTQIVRKVCTGVKRVYKYTTSAGSFIGTENHRVVENGRKVEVRDAVGIDVCIGGESFDQRRFQAQDVMDGLVLGDGSIHKASNNLVYLCVGAHDGDQLTNSDLAPLFIKHRPGLSSYAYEVQTTITHEELPHTYLRQVPQRFVQGDASRVRGFLRGLYSANGSIVANRVTLKAASLQVVEAVQKMLSSLGIASYFTSNKPHTVTFANGDYLCKTSYDLNITVDRQKFHDQIGFVQAYKNEALARACTTKSSRRKITYDVQQREDLGEMPVYDITVDADEHTYWTGGLLVSNCGEIILRPYGFCNLSIVVARADDTLQTLLQKVRTAAIFGTVQSLATHFPGLRDEWRRNAVEERLLGVDITGQADCPLLRDADVLYVLREAAVEQNRITAAQLGISPAAAVTCVKPSGNSSQLLGCSSGLHPRHAEYYIRNVRVSAHSPVYQVLRDANVPMSPENGQDAATATTWVVGFPVHSPAGSVLRKDVSALDALEGWKKSKLFWCEHNPSVTITYKPDEMIGIVAWLRENQDIVGGLSFLPYSDAKYAQMPYTEVTREEYEARAAAFPAIDWSRIALYETDDQTEAAQNLACVSGQCDI